MGNFLRFAQIVVGVTMSQSLFHNSNLNFRSTVALPSLKAKIRQKCAGFAELLLGTKKIESRTDFLLNRVFLLKKLSVHIFTSKDLM